MMPLLIFFNLGIIPGVRVRAQVGIGQVLGLPQRLVASQQYLFVIWSPTRVACMTFGGHMSALGRVSGATLLLVPLVEVEVSVPGKKLRKSKKKLQIKLLRTCRRINRIFTIFKNIFPPPRGGFRNFWCNLVLRWAMFYPLGSLFFLPGTWQKIASTRV